MSTDRVSSSKPSPSPQQPPHSVDVARRLMCEGAGRAVSRGPDSHAADGCTPLGVEHLPLHASVHRTLAEAILAPRPQPPFRSAAMDGYALKLEGLPERAAAGLEIIGEAAAGSAWQGTFGAEQAVRIFTGAPVPEGAEAVVAQERTRRIEASSASGARIVLEPDAAAALEAGANIRALGVDFAAGAALIPAGTRVNPRHVALIAAAGVGTVTVSRRPRIAVLANGNELRACGEPAGPFEIYDSVTPGLNAMIEEWGGEARPAGTARDEEPAISAAVGAAAAHAHADLLVIVGGASVGEYDHVRRTLVGLGLGVVVSSVAVRPGKPTWFGMLPRNGAHRELPVLGLPGNPAAAFVCAQLFLRPLIETLLGARHCATVVTAALEGGLPAVGAQEQYLRAHARVGADARLSVRPDPRQDTSLVSVYASSNALIRRPAYEPAASWGSFIEVLLLEMP